MYLNGDVIEVDVNVRKESVVYVKTLDAEGLEVQSPDITVRTICKTIVQPATPPAQVD